MDRAALGQRIRESRSKKGYSQQELADRAEISHLETVGPKLAHYYGYVLGNQLFPHVIPGYVADPQLTLRYRHTLEAYFGVHIQ